jgi:hypothetical protein
VHKKAKQATNSSHPLQTTRGTWLRTNTGKAQIFADHFPATSPLKTLQERKKPLTFIWKFLTNSNPPLSQFQRSEVQTINNYLKPRSSPGYNLITGKILQEFPPIGIKYLTQIFNSAMLTGYFPAQWKVAKIIPHLKPGKPPNEPISYRPISLLPILSKVYEKLLLCHLLPIVENCRLLPDHQFGFRQ